MELAREGQEYAHWTVTNAPDDANFEIQFDLADGTVTDWIAAEVPVPGAIRLLVAGPQKTMPIGIVLQFGDNAATIRFLDSPEDIYRTAGVITVV